METPSSKIVTTDDEIEAFYIIRGLLAGVVPVEDIVYRDTESYFGILYKDNNRKPICRINLDRKNKQIFIPDENKKFERMYIESLNDIYTYKDQLIEIVKRYFWYNRYGDYIVVFLGGKRGKSYEIRHEKTQFKEKPKGSNYWKSQKAIKKAVIPGYGKKGSGWVKNPKKVAYNKVYKKTTFGLSDLFK